MPIWLYNMHIGLGNGAKQMTNYNDMYLLVGSEELSQSFNDLASYYSDFHKDVWGVRPRHMALCACDYPNHASLVEAMSHLQRLVDGLHSYLEARKSTFEGREDLRANGWSVEETDPELARLAAVAQAERDALRAQEEYMYSHEYFLDQQVKAAKAKAEQAANDLESYFFNKYEDA